ncbi:Por secretion system C-terminal sorting domain-containing protein [Salinimicrobium sediminis]|uniref:Por secretion system C-terminal sorting domain-containing protein n=1 Tax=Salinimicrobium sediminis TaxID=1343891 RepID=A0A285X5G3_9FLAO|nr:T9SS type A sorting domain-containing protein [Salinimicrobium sediminis]SOC80583.1 Por secretion system C-terminal sorting domain-containing protein [Salinimicrobium sediminis]
MRRVCAIQKNNSTAVLLRHFFGCGVRQLTFIILLFSASVFAQNGVKITSTATSPTQQNPVPLTIKFDQPINGFERIDVDVKGGDIMNFQAGLPNYSLLANSRLRDFNINFDVVIPDNTNFEPSKDAVIAIDIDAEGYSYALTLKNGVFKYNPNGTPVTGNPIIKSEALNEARDIAIGDDEKVYIADSGSDKILIFNKTGGSTIGNIGDQKVSSPTGLAINFQNLIYVADTGNDRIVIFDPSGVQVGEINHGGGPGFDQMNDPIRLAVDNKNIVYVSDSGNNRIQIYNSDGTYKATIDGNTANLNNPGSLIVDNYGFLYVADFAGVNLNVFLEFENITTADILNLATNLENFRIQVFRTNSINEPPRTIKNGINIPIDLSFKPCGYLAVNNGDAKTDGKTIVIPGIPPKVVLPVNFLFDLKLYNRLPDTFTADLSIAVECTPVTITVPAGVGQNKDCQQAPATASNKFEILWDETAPIVESCSEEAVIKVESGFTIPNYFNIYEFTASDNCEGSLTFRQTPPSTTVITENTTVNIVAIDGAGNESAACTFQLVIAEEEDPSFDCDIPPATLDLDENCDYPERDFSFLITNQQNFVDGIFIEQKEERVGYILKVNIKVYHGENANDTFIGECNFEVVLLDRKVPLIESCNSSPVNLNLTSGTDFTIPDYSDRITYSDNCDADPTIIQIPKPGSVVDENTTVSLTVKDASGNISEVCSFSIIFDKTSNGISCHLTELPLGADGTAVLDAANVIDGNPNDPAIKSLVVEPSNFTCENLGLQPVKVKVTYDDGSTSECTTQVKVTDVLVPQIECPREPIVHTFDPEQGFVVPDYSKEFSVTDNCNFTITQVPAPGTVIFGSRQIDFIAEDSSNNTSFCYFSLILNASQDFEITSCPSSRIEDLNGKCEFELLDYTSEVQTSVPYSKVIQQPAPGTIISEDTEVTLTATLDGESVSCFFNVQLTNFSEVLLYCLNDLTVDANGDGTYILEDYTRLANSDGACGALTYTQDPPPGTIINSDTEVTLTVTDENGKTDDCSFKVNFKESNPGTVECKPTDLYLTQSGDNTLDPRELYKGDANDPLIESFSVDKDYFTCEDLGPQPVVLTVHFKDGTSQDCSTEIVVKDRIDPDVFCIAPGKEFTLINGSVTIDVNDLLADLDDNCGVLDYWLSQETFTSAGTKTVTINAEDSSGNTNSCTTTIEVIAASTSPGSCKPAIIYLDASGSATLDPAEVFEGDPDAGSIEDMIVNRNSFTCDDLGEPVEVNLTVKYANGTNTTCTALVTVKDIIAPEIVCVEEFTLHLNEAGVGKITPEIFDRGSSDNCGFQMSLSKENFDLDDVGEQEVILTVTDAAGNTSTCITTVTVEAYDEENPGISCVDELTLPLSQTGDFFLELNYTGDDENEDYTISKETFSCEDIGTQFITVTYWGEYTGTCEIKVTVVDDMAPVIECLEEIDVRLNASGTASLSIEDLDLEYSDNCSVADSALSRTNFTTADLGKSEITFSVTDGSGNTSTCTTTVNVLPFEGEEPQAIECVDLHVIQIKENGKAILNPRELFTGGTGTTQFTVSKDTFTCLDIGENTVTLEYTTPTESGACEIKVVVEDPLQICGEPVDPSNGDYIIMYPNPSLGIVRFQTSPGLEIHRVEVFDMRGRYLFEKVYDQNSIFDRKLDLQEYQSGVYTILIYTNGKEYLKRAIIRN